MKRQREQEQQEQQQLNVGTTNNFHIGDLQRLAFLQSMYPPMGFTDVLGVPIMSSYGQLSAPQQQNSQTSSDFQNVAAWKPPPASSQNDAWLSLLNSGIMRPMPMQQQPQQIQQQTQSLSKKTKVHENNIKNDMKGFAESALSEFKTRRERRNVVPKSRYIGVSWDSNSGSWVSQISSNNVAKFIGRYDSVEEAARAYDNAARSLLGPDAEVNFKDTTDVSNVPKSMPLGGADGGPQVSNNSNVNKILDALLSSNPQMMNRELLQNQQNASNTTNVPESPGSQSSAKTEEGRGDSKDVTNPNKLLGYNNLFETGNTNQAISTPEDMIQQLQSLKQGRPPMFANGATKTPSDISQSDVSSGTTTGNRTTEPTKKSSIYRGVCWNKCNNSWKASIKINKRNTHIGYFDDMVEAALAYDVKAYEIRGEKAVLNFPQKLYERLQQHRKTTELSN